ncbi:hypothetical protein SDRG_05669 [Saprolegnia diclina VS20]|uniref:Mediator complex subunit 15 KIX domain-containing protein n=1 Tax=Saprolegnia diclina (strain VS20) TaxID=1156394 RepID=T0QFW0_SAPDV|nr:hypothetical protein SDRG_05669 [Saprolegnia diclina VS20]EQC36839.1 hypothetical protein SDRG_05669 [Saprolegnia diclina VS20]|eukprot:XP_008609620.1 hypothetical protein SDRG_05669 [Saprolegnia diclina VS20]
MVAQSCSVVAPAPDVVLTLTDLELSSPPAACGRSIAQQRQYFVRLLCREVLKVHTLLRAPFEKRTVIDTCRSVEESLFAANADSFDAYVRHMRTRVQLIAKKGCALVRQTSDDDVVQAPTEPTNAAPATTTHEETAAAFQQAQLRYTVGAAWIKNQRKRARFRWSLASPAEDAHVDAVMASARAEVLASLRTMYAEPLALYEAQLRSSLAVQHRDWVAYDLSVVQSLRDALRPDAETDAEMSTLHTQIQRLLKEKALFDYMWAMEMAST